jgi:hypothetical protein
METVNQWEDDDTVVFILRFGGLQPHNPCSEKLKVVIGPLAR